MFAMMSLNICIGSLYPPKENQQQNNDSKNYYRWEPDCSENDTIKNSWIKRKNNEP